MKSAIQCKANLELLTTEEGGRRSAIHSNYQGRFQPDTDREHLQEDYFAVTEVLGPPISPGTKGTVLICVGLNGVVPEVWPGLEFSLREGARVVARGRVTELAGSEGDK